LLDEKEEVQIRTRKDYEKFDTIHHQEKQNLQDQLHIANERLIDYEQQFDDLKRKYEKAQDTAGIQIVQLEKEIQQQRIQIEEFNLQMREIENSFQLERRQLERERDFEKQKNFDLQDELDASKRQWADLRVEYDRFQRTFGEQQEAFEQQIRNYQNQLAQFNRERDHANDEVQNLRRENQALKDRARELEDKMIELTRKSDEFKSKISVYEYRFQDNEDMDKRNRNEINKLQRDIQDITRENQDQAYEINEWKRKYETIKNDLKNSQYEKETIESENQTVHHENAKLKHDIDELSIQIRLQIQQEYEDEYRQLISAKDTTVQNIQKDNEAIRYDVEQLNNERTRLIDQLQSRENSLRQANETIESYEMDIKHLRQALNLANEKNEQIEQEISRSYNDELKMKTDRFQDLENKYHSIEIQLRQYETIIHDLRHENAKLIDYNEQLQRDYDQYRRHVDDAAANNLTTFEERVRTEVIQATKNKQDLIDSLEGELQEKNKIIKELQHASSSYERKDLLLELEIRIEQLEQEVEIKERYIKTYSDTIQDKEQQIVKLLDSSDQTVVIETLRAEIRKLEQLSDEDEHHLSELKNIIRDRDREIGHLNDKLQFQQRDLEDCYQKRDTLTVKLNITLEENEAYLDRIKTLERQLEMSHDRSTANDQLIIDDLRSQLRQRDDSIQSLQRTIEDSDRDLRDTRRVQNDIQSDYNRAQLRFEQMQKQYEIDLENRDQIIASLRRKVTEKDEEVDKLRESDIAKEALLSKLRSSSRSGEYSGGRAPTNVQLQLEVQQKEDKIAELQQELDRARRDRSRSGRDDSSDIHRARPVEIQRPHPKNFDHLNREELLYELEMALQDNEDLVQQLAKKTPNITELHNQLLDIRKELARQKYVNQVLWRKLDALIDIHGSNTRAELVIELANYHDELEALKAKQHRIQDARSNILNPLSRSSSGVCVLIIISRFAHFKCFFYPLFFILIHFVLIVCTFFASLYLIIRIEL
jgi:chromosome segregation ATPase